MTKVKSRQNDSGPSLTEQVFPKLCDGLLGLTARPSRTGQDVKIHLNVRPSRRQSTFKSAAAPVETVHFERVATHDPALNTKQLFSQLTITYA